MSVSVCLTFETDCRVACCEIIALYCLLNSTMAVENISPLTVAEGLLNKSLLFVYSLIF